MVFLYLIEKANSVHLALIFSSQKIIDTNEKQHRCYSSCSSAARHCKQKNIEEFLAVAVWESGLTLHLRLEVAPMWPSCLPPKDVICTIGMAYFRLALFNSRSCNILSNSTLDVTVTTYHPLINQAVGTYFTKCQCYDGILWVLQVHPLLILCKWDNCRVRSHIAVTRWLISGITLPHIVVTPPSQFCPPPAFRNELTNFLKVRSIQVQWSLLSR
jgi:hypothetical protein